MGFEVHKGFEDEEDKQKWGFRTGNQRGEDPCRDNGEIHREDSFIGLKVELVWCDEDDVFFLYVIFNE